MTHRYPSILPQLRDESGMSYEAIAREIEVTVGALMKWKAQGHTIDSVVLLLNFAASRGFKDSAFRLAKTLQGACGPRVRVAVTR